MTGGVDRRPGPGLARASEPSVGVVASPFDECVSFHGGPFSASATVATAETVIASAFGRGPAPAPSSVVRLKLRLATGCWIAGDARVASKSAPSEQSCRVELEWTRISAYDARLLEEAAAESARTTPALLATLQIKHWVERSESGAIALLLGHQLVEPDCESLETQLALESLPRTPGGTRLFLNSVDFRSSPASTLRRLRRVFERLAARGPVLGVLTAGDAIPRAQLCRVLRDAGIGESFVCCNAGDEAREVWARLLEAGVRSAQPGGERPELGSGRRSIAIGAER